MSRRRQKPPRRLRIPVQELNAIVERTRSGPLPEAEQAILKAAVETLARVTAELESTQTTLTRVKRILFGSPTETTAAVLGEEETAGSPSADAQTDPAAAGATKPAADGREAEPGTAASASDGPDTPPPGEKKKRPGHGRNVTGNQPAFFPTLVVVTRMPSLDHGMEVRHGDDDQEVAGEAWRGAVAGLAVAL